MKTIEEKAKTMTMDRYEEALKRAKEFVGKEECINLEYIFPELKESEDEKIRKALINFFDGWGDKTWDSGIKYSEVVAWLEKQENKDSQVILPNILWHDGSEEPEEQHEILCEWESKDAVWHDVAFYHADTKTFWNGREKIEDVVRWIYVNEMLEKQGEQKSAEEYNITGIGSKNAQGKLGEMIKNLKPVNEVLEQKLADKVEPKFKVGDTVKDPYGDIYHITEITNDSYKTDDGRFILFTNENAYRLWTIQDAKDGDVLAEDSCIFIIQKLDDKDTAKTYCTLFDDGDFDDSSILCFDIDNTKPATKEQRDLLFQKMKEAGYEWDAENKELKEIEQKSAKNKGMNLVEEDMTPFQKKVFCIIDTAIEEEQGLKQVCDELLRLAHDEIIQKAWSEEDEMIALSIEQVMNCASLLNIVPEKIDKIRTWLKTLKDRVGNFDKGFKVGFSAAKYNQWKSSEEQMDILSIYAHVHDGLASLYQDLKKLKG